MERNSQETAATLDERLKAANDHLAQILFHKGQRIDPAICRMLCEVRDEFEAAGQAASELSKVLGNPE